MARRRPRTTRAPRISRRTASLAALGAACLVLFAVLVPIQTVLYGTALPLSFILGAALCGAPLLAPTHPRWAIAAFSASAFALPLLVVPTLATESPWPWSVPALLTFVLFVGVVTFLHGARVGALPLTIGSVLSLTAPLLRPEIVDTGPTAGSATADLIVTVSVAAAMFLVAILVAGRVRVSAELTREREHSALEESRRALVEERTRIARELHDVIAHSMSVIQVQASTARYRLPDIGDAASGEFDSIAATARSSLTEMRRMLGVLRTEDQTAELAPQQDIDDIPALVDTIRRAGVTVGLEITGVVADAPQAVQIAAFRISQEALSNAVRHASGAPVTVRVQSDADAIGVRVRNGRSSAPSTTAGGGYGLRGMRERVELLGGSFTAGPTADGGWEVSAELPLRERGPHNDTTAFLEETP
ncbi:sensor histidine kinase [Microbacterium phyllosphaerae]|uniref:sensor histidine kinase n=1 Tax=Microbacterium phyllosphaerae TaxID=124798 RepID=UPI00216A1BD0|nr:sensor histidine kinase [Microbacterium phyllosphaerae]MCS3444367.1 signal transduction histidine kinase [Microbacterium phyllosphaerae]